MFFPQRSAVVGGSDHFSDLLTTSYIANFFCGNIPLIPMGTDTYIPLYLFTYCECTKSRSNSYGIRDLNIMASNVIPGGR